MAVRPETLDTPEGGLDLETRKLPPGLVRTSDEKVHELQERLLGLKALRPPEGLGCRDCWDRGRLAVIAEVEPGLVSGDALERLDRARALEPQGGLHWRECWVQGRDAAVAAIEGE